MREDLNILPGLMTVQTDREARRRWKTGEKVRFVDRQPEKIGGWTKNGSNTFLGLCRGIFDWVTNSFVKYLAIGTHIKLYVANANTYYDITPIRSSGTFANDPFAVEDGSTTVTVTHTGHGATVGSYVTIAGASAGGGITVNGEYEIKTVPTADAYTITHGSAATSTDATTGGAAATYAYQINIGGSTSVTNLGWGAGPFSAGTWGTARSASDFSTEARTWTIDQWGEDLIACPRGGGIYVWDASTGTGTRSTVISGAPTTAKGIFVSPEDKHLVAFGAHDGSVNDPLLIRWSDSNDYTYWTPADGHTAGTKRLNHGNEIVCAIKSAGEVLLFTDSHIFGMTFQGPPYTFSFAPHGMNGGIMGPNAAWEIDGKVYWMAFRDFYVYDGTIRPIPCDVHNHVFDDINTDHKFKVFCWYNRSFQEIWWLYCSSGSSEVDKYVAYNKDDGTWTFGSLARTAMVGDSDIFAYVYAAGTDGYMYTHETGTDANGSAITSSVESWDFEIGSGDAVTFIGEVVPDFKTLTGSIDLTLNGKKYPAGSVVTKGPYTLTSATKKINPKMRCRQISIALESSALGDHWCYGGIRPSVKAHGKR